MTITFSGDYQRDADRVAVSFETFVNGTRVVCKIAEATLEDWFENGDSLEVFRKHQKTIEGLTERIIEKRHSIPQNPLFITYDDIEAASHW